MTTRIITIKQSESSKDLDNLYEETILENRSQKKNLEQSLWVNKNRSHNAWKSPLSNQ